MSDLEERVTVLENEFWLTQGQVMAILRAIRAIAAESDPVLRLKLFDSEAAPLLATLIKTPLNERHMKIFAQAEEMVSTNLRNSFQ